MDEEKEIVTPEPIEPLPRKRGRRKKEEPKEGKALKGWALFFFILSCIMTGIIAASIALPFFMMVFGIISALCWVIFVVIGTVFTLGMMWLIDGMGDFNAGWMAFNEKLFDSSNTIVEMAAKAIPLLSIIGGSIVLITWLFMVIGISTDKNRKKFYTAMLIVLGVLSLAYIAIAVITILIHAQAIPTATSSSSLYY